MKGVMVDLTPTKYNGCEMELSTTDVMTDLPWRSSTPSYIWHDPSSINSISPCLAWLTIGLQPFQDKMSRLCDFCGASGECARKWFRQHLWGGARSFTIHLSGVAASPVFERLDHPYAMPLLRHLLVLVSSLWVSRKLWMPTAIVPRVVQWRLQCSLQLHAGTQSDIEVVSASQPSFAWFSVQWARKIAPVLPSCLPQRVGMFHTASKGLDPWARLWPRSWERRTGLQQKQR